LQKYICQWKEGIVNTAHEHIRIYYGDFGSNAKLVAFVSPPEDNCFTVQFVARVEPDETEINKIIINTIIDETKKDLDHFLVAHPREKDVRDTPWEYIVNRARHSIGELTVDYEERM